MIIEEDWGISPKRIRQFFLDQPDVTEGPNVFQYGTCQITLTPTQRRLMNKWSQVRTVVRFEGPDAEVKTIHQQFFLQFLSAGG